MDPFSLATGVIGIAGVGVQAVQTVQSARELRGNYRDADAQMKHVKAIFDMLESIRQDSSIKLKSKFAPAQSSFEAIGASFPRNLHANNTRRRLLWAVRDKDRATRSLSDLTDIEITTILILLLDQLDYFKRFQSSIMELKEGLAAVEERRSYEEKAHSVKPVPVVISPQQRNHSPETRVCQWMSSYFGINVDLIASKVDGQNLHSVILRCPISSTKVLKGRFQSFWPPWPSNLIYTYLRVQNVIPYDSRTVEACQEGNAALIKELLLSRKAHPNDSTVDKRTLLHFAIRSRNLSAVQVLLDMGADPNLTSPLNMAFFAGDVGIVEMLLKAGADLEYTNCRMWTSARYIFDPELSTRNSLVSIKLLDIFSCKTRLNCGQWEWDDQDRVGWTILHRAAAYGRGRDIKKLLSLQASPHIRTFQLNWLPISCAVNQGNESTFDALSRPDVISLGEIKAPDTRGWTLLHLAAQVGSVAIITKLLKLGFNPHEKTDGSTAMSIPEELKMKELTPEEIAQWYGKDGAYKQALKNAG
ncbi:hypothetical protein G7Y89_g13859 [Cudoniella acicularis]|uniref:Uncharacterized protein n=1 Tax=Cudoniella acicularis TaxID=354080 RepID=A0A8H4VVN5_9HELO|nr:hypothetical protein G7Y89_g13859 [Cudoniella acicularis]